MLLQTDTFQALVLAWMALILAKLSADDPAQYYFWMGICVAFALGLLAVVIKDRWMSWRQKKSAMGS